MDEWRLFVAVGLPGAMRDAIARRTEELPEEGLAKVNPSRLHITMKFLGNVPESELPVIGTALRGVEFAPFSVRLKGVGVFPNPQYIRVVWIGCVSLPLEELAATINEALAPAFPKEHFGPHLTLARVKRKVDLSGFLHRHAHDDLGSFDVKEFHLVRSVLSREGPVYTVVESYPARL